MMELAGTTIDKETAEVKFHEYRDAVRRRHNDEDAQIMRGYDQVRKGHQVISLTATLTLGGRDERNMPRLAVARASEPKCWLERCNYNGRVRFVTKRRCDNRHELNLKDVRDFAAGTLPRVDAPEGKEASDTVIPSIKRRGYTSTHSEYEPRYMAIVPSVPPALRPAHSLANYDVLWEVEKWALDPAPPVDPALLRHIGGDLYAVMAVWDLTELERLVIGARADA